MTKQVSCEGRGSFILTAAYASGDLGAEGNWLGTPVPDIIAQWDMAENPALLKSMPRTLEGGADVKWRSDLAQKDAKKFNDVWASLPESYRSPPFRVFVGGQARMEMRDGDLYQIKGLWQAGDLFVPGVHEATPQELYQTLCHEVGGHG